MPVRRGGGPTLPYASGRGIGGFAGPRPPRRLSRLRRLALEHKTEATLVAIAGGKDARDPGAVIRKLDQTRAKHLDMVLVHGGVSGVERIAA